MSRRKLIEEYLKEALLMQVATSNNNQPWTCSVYFAFDDAWNLFWISTADRRHSWEIRNNNKVAGTIVLPHVPGQSVRGLQFQGNAHELIDKKEVIPAMKLYAARFGMGKERVDAIVHGTDGHRCYRITPTLFVLFDEVNFPDNPRQEYKLV